MIRYKAAVFFLTILSCAISCSASAEALWTWVSGAKATNQFGTYGTKGEPAGSNVPGARQGSVSWVDGSGNLWLFGGLGNAATSGNGYLNDLWKFDGANWTWVGGSNSTNQTGMYGTKGTAAPGNAPGARLYSVSWVDTDGNLWLFGGYGFAASGSSDYLNDLWKFDGVSWTWVSGSNAANQTGVYGTKGLAAPGNVPGARNSCVSWVDPNGNFWLFGGYGYAASGSANYLNDLWKFDGANWTWVSGSNIVNQTGVYGAKGTAALGNVPGSRNYSVSWTARGNLWLFGGYGYAAGGGVGNLNDLWKFDGMNWTWVRGSDTTNQYGIYGLKGTAASGNAPGARYNPMTWTDARGNMWLFGGYGRAASGNNGSLNDLWKFDGARWTWVGGSSVVSQVGIYGTKGEAASGNTPGARNSGTSLIDAGGNLWLFGGNGNAVSASSGYLNDLWRFAIPENAADLSGDGFVDFFDLIMLADQWQTNPTVIPSADIMPFPAGDGIVDFNDFAILARNWNASSPEPAADINGDGSVDWLDLAVMVEQWCANPAVTPPADIAPSPSGDGIVNFRDFAFIVRNWSQGNIAVTSIGHP